MSTSDRTHDPLGIGARLGVRDTQAVNDALHQPAPLEYRQMWLADGQTEQIATLCTRAAQDGWSLHSVTFGKQICIPPGNGPTRVEGGWLVLFFRHAIARHVDA